MRTAASLPLLFGAWLAVCPLLGCGQDPAPVRTIADARVLEAGREDVRWNASAGERFGMRPPMGAASTPGAGGEPHLHWDTPPGWVELPTSSLRQANFQVAGDPAAECYLTVLSGTGGGLEANVNRWRKQMSLSPASPEEIAALPRGRMFGADALLVDVAGTWTGMSGDESGADHRLVGLAQVADGEARFLKMVGPASLVEAEFSAFLALAASFEEDTGTHTTASAAGRSGGSGLAWSAPDGWRRGPEKAMRAVTFYAGEGDQEAECYVTILGGAGGGLAANLDRWCQQMGSAPLAEAELAALPRIPMLGGEGVLIEVAGHYTGMGDQDVGDALLLGAVRLLEGSSVFVKMIGPRATVEDARAAFNDFCSSLELEG